MSQFFCPLVGALILGSIGAYPGGAETVIYNNGSPNLADGLNISDYIGADDFTLSSGSVITGAAFWASASADPFTSQFSGTIGWGLFADNAGQPGNLVASGYDSQPQLTDTGNQILGTEEYGITFSLPSVELIPGTYWLGLHDGPFGSPGTGTTIYWDTTGNQTGSLPMSTSDLSGASGWSVGLPEDNLDLAFELAGDTDLSSAAPEPTTFLPIFMVGAIVLLIRALRRTNRWKIRCSNYWTLQ